MPLTNLANSEKLPTLFSEVPAALAVLRGPLFIFEMANEAYKKLVGRQEIVGKPLLEAVPEIKDQPFHEILRKVYDTGRPFQAREVEVYLQTHPAAPALLSRRYVDLIYKRVQGRSDQENGIFVFAIDVTERVRTRLALSESEVRFRAVIDEAGMGTWELEAQTGVIDWSPRTRILLGGPETGTITLDVATANIHPEDLSSVQNAIARAIDPAGAGQCHIECRIQVLNENTRWVSLRGQAFFSNTPEGRKTTRYTGTVLDITERKNCEQAMIASERQFRMMADLMPQIIWTARPDGVLDYTNRRWFQYSGSDRPENWLDFVHPDDVPKTVKSWTTSVMTGRSYAEQFRLRRASDLTYRWFLVRANPAVTSAPLVGEMVERWFGTCTDIQEQKDALAAHADLPLEETE